MKNRNRDSSNRGQRLSRSKRLSGVCAEIVEQRLLLSTYTVNTTSDATNPGAGLLTLRQAVADANSNPGPDTINFDSTVFTPAALQTITLLDNLVEFTDTTGATTITGPGSAVLAVADEENGDLNPVFQINANVTVAMSGLEITDGGGSGILNAGSLTLSNSVVTENHSDFVGGGIDSTGPLTLTLDTIDDNRAGGSSSNPTTSVFCTGGGGVYATAALTIRQSTISGNSTFADGFISGAVGGAAEGGGIYAADGGTILASTISGNSAKGAEGYGNSATTYPATAGGNAAGGGIFSPGNLTISDSTIANNTSTGGEGGWIPSGGAPGGNSTGGGITAINLILADSTISGNTTAGGAQGYNPFNFPGFSNPTGTQYGGAIFATTVRLTNSIVGGGTFYDSESVNAIIDSSSAYNEFDGGVALVNGVNGNIQAFPQLSPLGNYGGPTQTMPPLAGDPALSHGNVSLIPAGLTTDQRGFPRISNGTVDIGATQLTGGPISGTVYDDPNDNGTDGGYYGTGIPGIVVYADLNNNGKLDPREPQTTTDSNGQFTLPNLPAGPVIIRQALPPGTRQTVPAQNLGLHVTVGTFYPSYAQPNFQDTNKILVSGNVFDDANGNGKLDPGESGIQNWTIYGDQNNDGKLDGNEPSKATSINGEFVFRVLNAGTYIFRVIPPPGWHQTFPANNFGQHVTLAAGGVVQNLLFGFAPNGSASISGSVFNDANGNGVQNTGELNLSGWTVYLDLDSAGTLEINEPTISTDANGDFTFNDLAAGTYVVRVVSPTGWSQTFPTNNFGQHVTLAIGQKVSHVLFGEKRN